VRPIHHKIFQHHPQSESHMKSPQDIEANSIAFIYVWNGGDSPVTGVAGVAGVAGVGQISRGSRLSLISN